MSHHNVLTCGGRTATLLLDATARYLLSRPVDWQLVKDMDQIVQKGVALTAVLFLDDLAPASRYTLTFADHTIDFCTKPCAGLVEAIDFGVSEGRENNQEAFAAAIKAVPKGGTLRLPAGRYETGPIFLKSQMTLLLEQGAELAASGSRNNWPQIPARDKTGRPLGTWEGLPERSYAALITGFDCTDLTISGRGVIDGGGDRADWWDWPKETRDGARRPRTVHLAYCKDTVLSGVTVRNSPSWTIHPYRCDALRASSLRVENPKDSPNTDGLNPESCRDVDITGVSFSVGDDCIAIKAGKRAPAITDHLAPCEDVSVRHCEMLYGHGAVVLGSEMSGDIRGVRIENCAFTKTDRGLRLKTRRGRGGKIEDVTMRNVHMTGVATPFAANAFYFCDPDGKSEWVQSRQKYMVDDTTPVMRRISLDNISAEDVSVAAVALLGLPEAPITDVTLANFTVTFDPDARGGVPLMAMGVPAVRHGTVIAEFAVVSGGITPPERKVPTAC